MGERYDITPQDYLATFTSGPGRRVLQHLLYEGHFFSECESGEEIAERNFVVRILRNMGAFDPENKDTMRMITTAVLDAGAVGVETIIQKEE